MTSYSVLLDNDWNQKVEANYNKKNGCYTFRWENKKHTISTTYKSNQPLPSQPTVTNSEELVFINQNIYTLEKLMLFTLKTHLPLRIMNRLFNVMLQK